MEDGKPEYHVAFSIETKCQQQIFHDVESVQLFAPQAEVGSCSHVQS
jgi:hypothetical protein